MSVHSVILLVWWSLFLSYSEAWVLLPSRQSFWIRSLRLFVSDKEYVVEVSYEGRSCKVPIRADETLLSGLERTRVPDRLAIPELPSSCRRGNCLTCVGRHANNSQEMSLQRGEDGLSPELSRQASKLGYILACSSHVVGDGLKLELGENHEAWKDLYHNRLTDESTQYVARSAMAKTIRRYDERHPMRWKIETETVLKKSGAE